MFHITGHNEKKHFCMYCLQHFSSERILNDHKENCIIINGTQGIKMPTIGEKIEFTNFQNNLPVPFVIFADFEAITEKMDHCKKNDNKSYTEAYQNHQVCGYGYKVVCSYYNNFTKREVIYRGEKAVYNFLEAMLKEVTYCKKIIREFFNKQQLEKESDEIHFKKANGCYICKKKYTDEDEDDKDKYYSPFDGCYKGSAHESCIKKYKLSNKIPVIFHNLSGYDSHFIMQEIGEIIKKKKYPKKDEKGNEVKDKDGKTIMEEMNITVIARNMEKYLSFTLGSSLKFIDSLNFMSSSLDKLVSYLPKDSFKIHLQKI